MTETLLVVCTANICRSPLAARELRRVLAGTSLDLVVESAGTKAQFGDGMCEVSAGLLATDDVGYADEHRSRPLTSEMVRDAGLVLTMERAHRSAAVQAAPGSQAKVFTLREAEALLAVLADRGDAPSPDLRALAKALHSVRGLVPLAPSEPVKRHWWSRSVEPEDPMTIEDGHGLSREEHTMAVQQVRVVADRVGAAIAARAAR